MTPRLSRDDKRVIFGGIIGAGLVILLLLTGTTPRWRQITLIGFDSGDTVTQIIAHDVVRTHALYIQAGSGAAYRCLESFDFFVVITSCQKIEHQSALKELEDSFQCNYGQHFPTISPPGIPVAQLESYPCGMGQFQTNHIVLSDGSLWRLEQGVAEDEQYWTIILVVGSGIFGFVAGMIGTALILALSHRWRRSNK